MPRCCWRCAWAIRARIPRSCHSCCETGRARWARKEASLITAALQPLIEGDGWRVLWVGLRAIRPTVPELERIRTRFVRLLRDAMKRRGVGYRFIPVTEPDPSGRPHDHALLVTSAPIDPEIVRELWRSAAGASGRPAYAQPARDWRECVRYAVKHERRPSDGSDPALLAVRIDKTWGTIASLYKPFGGKAELWRTLRVEWYGTEAETAAQAETEADDHAGLIGVTDAILRELAEAPETEAAPETVAETEAITGTVRAAPETRTRAPEHQAEAPERRRPRARSPPRAARPRRAGPRILGVGDGAPGRISRIRMGDE